MDEARTAIARTFALDHNELDGYPDPPAMRLCEHPQPTTQRGYPTCRRQRSASTATAHTPDPSSAGRSSPRAPVPHPRRANTLAARRGPARLCRARRATRHPDPRARRHRKADADPDHGCQRTVRHDAPRLAGVGQLVRVVGVPRRVARVDLHVLRVGRHRLDPEVGSIVTRYSRAESLSHAASVARFAVIMIFLRSTRSATVPV
jgi:hypothetical protein